MTIKLNLSKVTDKGNSVFLINLWQEKIKLLKEQQYLVSQQIIDLQEHIEAHEEHITSQQRKSPLP